MPRRGLTAQEGPAAACRQPKAFSWMRLSSHQLGGALRMLQLIITIVAFLDFFIIWHLGVFGSMGNTPTGCADDSLTILGISKKWFNVDKFKHFFQRLNLDPNNIFFFCCQPKLLQVKGHGGKNRVTIYYPSPQSNIRQYSLALIPSLSPASICLPPARVAWHGFFLILRKWRSWIFSTCIESICNI